MIEEKELPLKGLRVLDFGHYLAGPTVGMILADQGAEVIRIDPPGGPRWVNHAKCDPASIILYYNTLPGTQIWYR
jgi:crotonobetainyl-CoA:carnitine CoA-transferase CaiB-like acyl-CoA transferase